VPAYLRSGETVLARAARAAGRSMLARARSVREDRGVKKHIALLRGINVGRAKRIAMADLRALVEGLGYQDVRTLLNSGNVVFTVPAKVRGVPASRIEKALAAELGLVARVTGIGADELAEAIEANPLTVCDPSRVLVAFVSSAADLEKLRPLARADWAPDELAIGKRVAYIVCDAGGILDSKLVIAANRALGDRVTMRNWTTVSKLAAM
jgi:uncharacterized protein (DUF1697 family)